MKLPTCLNRNEDGLTFGAKVEREDLDGIPVQPVSRWTLAAEQSTYMLASGVQAMLRGVSGKISTVGMEHTARTRRIRRKSVRFRQPSYSAMFHDTWVEEALDSRRGMV
jgi:hypothetical protein